MAFVKNNAVTKGLSGRFEGILFRHYRGKTFVSPMPKKPTRQSEQQKNNRQKFKLATEFAKKMMQVAEMKTYYARKAKKLKLPNAYTAAITDYMRKPQINNITLTGKRRDHLTIAAFKNGFEIQEVNILISTSDDRIVELGAARREVEGQWEFKVNASADISTCSILIKAKDRIGNDTEKTVQLRQ